MMKRQALMRAALEQLKGWRISGDLSEKISNALASRRHNPGLWRAFAPCPLPVSGGCLSGGAMLTDLEYTADLALVAWL